MGLFSLRNVCDADEFLIRCRWFFPSQSLELHTVYRFTSVSSIYSPFNSIWKITAKKPMDLHRDMIGRWITLAEEMPKNWPNTLIYFSRMEGMILGVPGVLSPILVIPWWLIIFKQFLKLWRVLFAFFFVFLDGAAHHLDLRTPNA